MLTKSKSLFISLLFLLVSLSAYGVPYAQALSPQKQVMFSNNCGKSLQYGTAARCWDTANQWMYYWTGSVFFPVGRRIVFGSLPTCNSSQLGLEQVITNSTTVSAEGQTCVGGSTHKALAICLDGGTWKCF